MILRSSILPRLSALLIALLPLSLVYAQNAKLDGPGTVSGNVTDASTSSSVEFATVSLYTQSDSSLITGAITKESGDFVIPGVPLGNYYAKVGFIGYDFIFIDNIQITEKALNYSAPSISLKRNSQNLGELTVVAEKELVEVRIDRTVYNTAKDPGSQGGTGLDVLSNIPLIDVDEEDRISLRNDNSVQVLIDGRPSPIAASELLKQIPATLIERVEVITNPSAKYDPEGMSGIINVILKKEKAKGISGNASASIGYGTVEKHNGSFNLTYRKRKTMLWLNTGLNKWSGHNSSEFNRTITLGDSLYYQNHLRENSYEARTYWYSGGIDYTINEKNTVYVWASTWDGWNGSDNEFFYENLNSENETETFSNRAINWKNPKSGRTLGAGLQKKFDSTGFHILDIDLRYHSWVNHRRKYMNEDYYLANGGLTGPAYQQNTEDLGARDHLILTLDYELPLGDSTLLEAGLKSTFHNYDNSFYSESTNNLAGILTPDTALSGTMQYGQDVHAGYITFGHQFKRLGVQAGTRVEHVILNVGLADAKENFDKTYTKVFPSVFFNYLVKEKHTLKLSYSRRINKPQFWELRPFAGYEDPYRLYIGNPDLNPEYINVYELGYIFQSEKVTLTPGIYYRDITDKKLWVYNALSTGGTLGTLENWGRMDMLGGDINVRYNPSKSLRVSATVNAYHRTISNSNSIGGLQSKNYGLTADATTTALLKKGWTVQLRQQFASLDVGLQGIEQSQYFIALSIMKKVLKDKGNLSLKFSDLINSKVYRYESRDLGGVSFKQLYEWETQHVFLTFTYSFGTMKESIKGKKKNKSSEDTKIKEGSPN